MYGCVACVDCEGGKLVLNYLFTATFFFFRFVYYVPENVDKFMWCDVYMHAQEMIAFSFYHETQRILKFNFRLHSIERHKSERVSDACAQKKKKIKLYGV